MYDTVITVDADKLREDMKNDSLGAFFGGGYGGALFEASRIERASDQELVEMARNRGVDFYKYKV